MKQISTLPTSRFLLAGPYAFFILHDSRTGKGSDSAYT